ncbi:MAG: glutamate formimidoyltransferase [Planctomycetota bacterium]
MDKVVECVPNFSEGRDKDVIEKIAQSVRDVSGVKLLDVEGDAAHNRCVLTFVGAPGPVGDAAFAGVARAAELIDLTKHMGEHPRMGATDVVPFVPVHGVTMEDCVALARATGGRIGEELNIPVFLYEEAATRPERRNLANVRKGQFEALRDAIGRDPARKPDFGPEKIHPTAGATAVGAREFLIAFNVNLDSNDLPLAKAIANKIREAKGGLPKVKAMGFEIAEKGFVQISMNLTNYTVTPIRAAFDAIKTEAEKAGVEILNSELIGLAPRAALGPGDVEYMKIKPFNSKMIVENNL